MDTTKIIKELAVINGKRSEYKKYALARQLCLPDNYYFPKNFLEKLTQIPIGIEFTINNRIFKCCYLMKKRALVKLDQMSGFKKENEKITINF